MKKLCDIVSRSERYYPDIDCRSCFHATIEKDFSYKKSDTIIAKKPKDLKIIWQERVYIEPKKISFKNFDGLEKTSIFTSLFRRDIVLRPRIPITRRFYNYFQFFINYYLDVCKKIISKIKYFFIHLSLYGYVSFLLIIISSSFLILFLTKHTIESRVNNGYTILQDISHGGKSFDEIRKAVNQARFDFLVADILFTPFRFLNDDRISSVSHMIQGGRSLTYTLDNSISLVAKLWEFVDDKNPMDIYWVHVLHRLKPHINNMSLWLQKSIDAYNWVTWMPHPQLEDQRKDLIAKLVLWKQYIETIEDNYQTILSILWEQRRTQYLIAFQNADEIRPTWGFMWSMALVSMFRGKIDMFQKKDIYAIEWDLKLATYEREPAPKGINELTEYFWLRDANYFINTKDSAESIQFFVNQAGLDVDGIIFLNQNSLIRLLEISWPVYFDALKTDIDHNNFSEIISLLVESKVFHVGTLGTPKQVLFEFVPVFFDALQDRWLYAQYIDFIFKEVKNREVVVWFFDKQRQDFAYELWIDGTIDFTQSKDFWFPVYTSISWNKSDRYMQRHYSYHIEKTESCDYDVSLQIQSTHAMIKTHRDKILTLKNDFWIEHDEELMYIQGMGRNRQFVRYLLPKEAEVYMFDGWEIVDYGSRKWIEFFLETPFLETSRFWFRYRLINPLCKPYSFQFFKQAGIKKYDIDITYNDRTDRFNDMQTDFYFEK